MGFTLLVSKQDGKVIVESKELEVIEMGDSWKEAMYNFVEYVVDQFTTLKNYAKTDRLTEKARRLLNVYEEYIK